MPNSSESYIDPPALGELLGYASLKIGGDAPLPAVRAVNYLKPEIVDKPYKKPYRKEVVELYTTLWNLAEGVTPEEAGDEIAELTAWTSSRDPKKGDIDLTDPEVRLGIGKALRGLDFLGRGTIGDSGAFASADMMNEKQRAAHKERQIHDLRERLGVPDKNTDVDKAAIHRLLGDILVINPSDIKLFSQLLELEKLTFSGKISEEIDKVMTALGKEAGEQTTYGHLLALGDITKMSAKDYEGHLAGLKPLEIFYLSQVPFTLIETAVDAQGQLILGADGKPTKISRVTKLAELVDWMVSTDEGKRNFFETPHESMKMGLSEYIAWLKKTFPNVKDGADISSNYKISTPEGFVKAKPFDYGSRGFEDVPTKYDPHLAFAENSTGFRWYMLARGIVHAIAPLNMLYRSGNIPYIGTELQKFINLRTFYYEYYTMFNEQHRLEFPRFGSLAERMANDNPLLSLLPQKENVEPTAPTENRPLNPDLAIPFDPRSWEKRNDGISVKDEGLNPVEKTDLQILLVDLFYAVEEAPGEGMIEAAVEELYRGKNGYYYNSVGDPIGSSKLTDNELIRLAWKWNDKIRVSLRDQCHVEDEKLDTLMNYRTFYPLRPEEIIKKLKTIKSDSGMAKVLKDRVDFAGLYQRWGGILEKDEKLMGVEGAIKTAELMGSGLWCWANWGTQPADAPLKHAGYLDKLLKAQDLIEGMDTSVVQAKTSELKEAVGESAASGKADIGGYAIKTFDKILMASQGIQADVDLRRGSVDDLLKNYGELIQLVGFMGKQKGKWWVLKRAEQEAMGLFGYPTSYQYLAKGRNYYVDENNKKVNKPLTEGDSSAEYSILGKHPMYKETPPAEALAVLGIYLNTVGLKEVVEPIYPARAGKIVPIAIENVGGELKPVKINIQQWYGHQKPIAFKSPRRAVEIVVESLWETYKDTTGQTDDKKTYFLNVNEKNEYILPGAK